MAKKKEKEEREREGERERETDKVVSKFGQLQMTSVQEQR